MAREKASAQAEMAGLRERLECEGLSVRRSGAGLGGMRAVEAVREAEVGREQAEARERTAQLNAERARRQWDLARQQFEVAFSVHCALAEGLRCHRSHACACYTMTFMDMLVM